MGLHFRVLFVIYVLSSASGDPTGCTYDASTILFTCNARSWSLPLVFSDFTTAQPQRLMLKDVDGEISASAPNGPAFSGFSSINTATFDPDYAPALYIMCYFGGQLILDKDAFADFSYVEEVEILNCDILSIPVEAFSYFGDVNLFHIQGGSISNMVADSFKNLNVNRMTTVPNPKGEFAIINSELTSGALAFGALFNMPNIERVLIENAHLSTVTSDMFYALSKLNYASLNYNTFTTIPNNMFANVFGLASVDMYGISWDCSCDNLWFLDYLSENNITMNGDIVCSTPVDYEHKRATKYNLDTCVTDGVCGKITGIAIGSTCVSMFELINYILLLITLVISCAALGLIIHTKRQVSDTIEPNKPEQSPSRNTSQNRIASNQREPPSLEELQAGPLPRKQTGATISNMDSIDTEA
ncbi:unnamed protein product [Mytilus edulis]|uniref:Uncharacterized protein n=1 Tax=Mytilus edulis TaxID=6550 RepID=A0A8S3TAB3_MYTED|nr:unnamed protein product [Mytilus edulis]